MGLPTLNLRAQAGSRAGLHPSPALPQPLLSSLLWPSRSFPATPARRQQISSPSPCPQHLHLAAPLTTAAAALAPAGSDAESASGREDTAADPPDQPSRRRRLHGANADTDGATTTATAADLAAAALLSDEQLRALGVTLPTHCCGCGIRLQRQDATAPGFFIVPARLLEPQDEQEEDETGGLGAEEDAELDPVEAARREMDAGVELDFDDVGGSSRDAPDVLCQRCFSLKHAGKIKVQAAELSLPAFDLGKKVGRKIYLQKDRRAVVLCVVDVWDFDGSLPRAALRSLFPPRIGDAAPEELKFSLMVAVNKFDLLPSAATAPRVQQWVRLRLKQAGLPSPDKVFMVSAVKGLGVKDMVADIRQALGFRGDLWVVGAQNAGKSSLISAMKRLAGTAGRGDPTIAPVPGTTLGLLQVPGLPLGPKHRAFDTPGVPHSHQLTTYLGLEEVKQVLPAKQLRGRTYRLAPGNTLFLGGGLARVDVLEAPGPTLYLTVFVSHAINLHLGKTDGADERLPRLVEAGVLVPPSSPAAAAALPPLEPHDVSVAGTDWRRSTSDIAIAGLGWIGVGCSGPARFRVWTFPRVAITTHPALVPDYSEHFERPGVSTLLPKAQARSHLVAKQEKEERRAAKEERRGDGGLGNAALRQGALPGRVVGGGGAEARGERERGGEWGGRGGRGRGRGGRGGGGGGGRGRGRR